MTAPVRITFLGGLGEIGRNCAIVEQDDRLMILDCGLMFPDAEMLGVDLVLPDFTWLRENADRVEGCIITHGHEDHMGGLSYLLRELSFPIYGSHLTLGLAKNRIEEAGLLGRTELIPVVDGERRRIGPFDCEFIPVTHSVPHGFATAFHTPQGVILHSGDFKIDLTPVDGRCTDLARIGALAAGPGIRLLLSDSTNAEEPGHTPSEISVGKVLRTLFAEHADKRIITACFASHIHRVQQIADAAVANGRVVATLGRSMAKNVSLARQMGLLTIPDDSLVDIERIGDHDPRRVCVISTGSQGEPMSALSLMAAGENKWLKVGDGDTIIISAHAIPGNEYSVNKVIDGLYRLGAEVVHSGLADVHVTGHAKSEELKTLLSLAQPAHFIPVHGEFRHLTHHARLAIEMGVPENNVLLAEDGDVIELSDDGIDFVGVGPRRVPLRRRHRGRRRPRRAARPPGALGGGRDRGGRHRRRQERRAAGPARDHHQGMGLRPRGRGVAGGGPPAGGGDAASRRPTRASSDIETLKRHVRQAVGRFVNEKTKRRPMIVPVVMEA